MRKKEAFTPNTIVSTNCLAVLKVLRIRRHPIRHEPQGFRGHLPEVCVWNVQGLSSASLSAELTLYFNGHPLTLDPPYTAIACIFVFWY